MLRGSSGRTWTVGQGQVEQLEQRIVTGEQSPVLSDFAQAQITKFAKSVGMR
jgi:hypothetical protein